MLLSLQNVSPDSINIAVRLELKKKKKPFFFPQAAVKNSPEVIETLLDLGAPIDLMDEFKHTAILRAAEFGHIDVVRLLCYRGCDTNV